MSPDLYNIYSEAIMDSIRGKEGISGVNINNIRYADDTTLLAESENSLQEMMDTIVENTEAWSLKINDKKTCCMVISTEKIARSCNIKMYVKHIKQVESFTFLGDLVTSDVKNDKDISKRTAIANRAFQNMRQLFSIKGMRMEVRFLLLKCCIWNIL